MSFQTALSNLAALSVTGITQHYSIDTIPDQLHRAQLPALLVMPIETQDRSLYQDSGRAFDAVAFSDGTKTVQYVVTHLLVIAPEQKGKGLREHLPMLVNCMDNYLSALAANITLNAALDEPAQVRVEPGTFTLGHSTYIGCAFRHRWIIAL